jgi:hypothetical protein
VDPFTSDTPSEAIAFLLFIAKWAEADYKLSKKLDKSPWRPFRCLKMLRGGWANFFINSKEGTAVGFLLVWCGRSATTLVAAGHKL